uniref:glutathione transferase n=1 Tax=Hucho hucho TaxID=62062 RepID=A0A4W5KCD4_9TELE
LVYFTLTYFPVRGCAEVIRVMLKDQGAEFDKNVLFGQLPKFEDWGLTLYQINVVWIHLARKLGRWRNNINDSGKEGDLKALLTDLMPFEKTLSRNKGSFLVDNKIHMSLADYALMLLLIHHQVLSPPCLDAFPSFQKYLRRLCEDVKNRPIILGKRA